MAGEQADEPVTWITVKVDENGTMIVRDEVEGIESDLIETIMRSPRSWAADIEFAILTLLKAQGFDLNSNSDLRGSVTL